MSRPAQLQALRKQLRGAEKRDRPAALRFGLRAIDEHLPWEGLPAGLHELCPARGDLPDEAASIQMAALLLAAGRGPVVWALGRRFLFAPGLAETGLMPARVVYAEAGDERDILAIAEEALRYGGLAGVVAEAHKLSLHASRRLQLAAESTGTPCLMLRRWKRGQPPLDGTAVMTRWSLAPRPSSAESDMPRPSWNIELLRCRGGRPASWNVELEGGEDEKTPLRLRLATELASAETGSRLRRDAA